MRVWPTKRERELEILQFCRVHKRWTKFSKTTRKPVNLAQTVDERHTPGTTCSQRACSLWCHTSKPTKLSSKKTKPSFPDFCLPLPGSRCRTYSEDSNISSKSVKRRTSWKRMCTWMPCLRFIGFHHKFRSQLILWARLPSRVSMSQPWERSLKNSPRYKRSIKEISAEDAEEPKTRKLHRKMSNL